jgi:hypothetical protein
MCITITVQSICFLHFLLWVQTILISSIMIEALGTRAPSWMIDMVHYLKQSEWYRSKHKKKKTKYKGCKKYLWRLRILPLALTSPSSMWTKERISNNWIALTGCGNYVTMSTETMSTELNEYNSEGVTELERDEYALMITNHMRFESDSVPIKVDNCCTQSITGYIEDFVEGTIKTDENKQVRGFGKTINKIMHQGTIR